MRKQSKTPFSIIWDMDIPLMSKISTTIYVLFAIIRVRVSDFYKRWTR